MRTPIVTQRFNKLAGTLAELKVKVRTALATELAGAVGIAVRDILVVAMIDHMVATPSRPATKPPLPRSGGWRDDDDERERDRWREPKDPWADPDDFERERMHAKDELDEPDEEEPSHRVPTAAVIAVGVNVGRWWLSRHGTLTAAFGVGALIAVFGLAGGPLARAALAVIAAATDVLTAESALTRLDPS